MTERLNDVYDVDPDDHMFNGMFPGSDPENSCKFFSIGNFNELVRNPIFNLSLFNCNVRSYHANGLAYESLFNSLSCSPDFVVMTETWNSCGTLNLCTLDGYTGIHTHRTNTRGGGVSVFFKNSFTAENVPNLSVCNSTIETCVVRIFVQGGYLLILGVYRPHTDSIENFTLYLESVLNNHVVRNAKLVLLAGDMNINLLDMDCSRVQNYVNMLHSLHFLPAITKPTRFSNNHESSTFSNLDHIWINEIKPFFSGVLCVDISDHSPTFLFFNFNLCTTNPIQHCIRTRPYSERKFNSVKSELLDVNWDEIIGNVNRNIDVNTACSNFVEKINNVYCKYFPIKVKFISDKRIGNPWLTPQLKKMINRKSEYFKLFKLGFISRENNLNFNKKVNASIKKAKENYYKDAFNQSKSNMKKNWKLINALLGSNPKNKNIKKLVVDNHEFVNPSDIANQFNSFFCDIALKLESELPPSSISHKSFLGSPKPNSFYLYDVKIPDCLKIISKLKITSSDLNLMPVKIFKMLRTEISNPLCKLINLSFYHGKFPDILKIARITPIFKKGDNQNPSNYRPIASLPYLSKIFERCMADKLTSFLNKFSLLSKVQFGFQKHKSTCDALINLTEYIYDNLNNRKTVVNVLVDLRRAFDTVNHGVLIDKLFNFGVRGLPLRWFSSYLLNREQFVRINFKDSMSKTINIGVPQGSILGPLLFLIYINDLPNSSHFLFSTLFADDTTLSISDSSFNNIIPLLNDELKSIQNWTISNKLSINVDKTEIIKITNKINDNSERQIKLGDDVLKLENSCMFLGVNVDKNLNFSLHINSITSKISKNTGIFYRIRNNLTERARLNFYYAFIFPFLSYNVIVWGGTCRNHLNPLVVQQKRIIRLIANAGFVDHTNPLFFQLKILKFDDIYRFFLCIYMFKARKYGLYSSRHNRNTRNRELACPPFHRLSQTQRSVSFAGPLVWNMLPSSLRSIDNLASFKFKLKQYFISRYIV